MAEHNARRRREIELECAALRGLPPGRAPDYVEASVVVTTSGGFSFRRVFYTVPSRLIGRRLRLRVHEDRLEAYLGGTHLLTLPRRRASPDGRRGHVVDYRLRRVSKAFAVGLGWVPAHATPGCGSSGRRYGPADEGGPAAPRRPPPKFAYLSGFFTPRQGGSQTSPISP